MKTSRALLNWSLALTCVSAWATEKLPEGAKVTLGSQGQSTSRVDNTNINDRDMGGATKTPQDQSNRAQDRDLLAAVRRAIVGDKLLSTMAHNVKVLVDRGTVTLRGPVKNSDEKDKVELLAKKVNGVIAIDNQLDVKTNVSTQ